MFTKRSLGCGLFHILLVMWPVQDTSQLPGSSLFNFSLLNESSAHIGSSLLVSNLCRGLTVHSMSCVLTGHLLRTQSIANCFLPSRVKQSDGLGQGTLPGTFDYWHVFWSIASPLLKKYEKNESQSARYPQKPVAFGRGILCYLNCDKWSCVPSHT